MAVIVLLSPKCAPGVSTASAVLAYAWPCPVLLADCDPGGGDLAAGWLGQWLVDGHLTTDRGVLSYATATRHTRAGAADALEPHLQVVPVAPRARLLRGLDGQAQRTALDAASWQRLAHAVRERGATDHSDVLIDAGRFGGWTPRPLLNVADLTLLAVRPLARHVLAAAPALAELGRCVEPDRLGIAALATTTAGTRDIRKALGHRVNLELPDDPRTARVFSDGVNAGEPFTLRSSLVRAATTAGTRLHHALNLRPPPPPLRQPDPATTERAQSAIGGGQS
ncbi:hypothetical protein [Haloechinothrix salitolerans]|uniref:Cellulose biosynthesis protein BcsQ n=1 Tax=Haloechinothrix salitolerans TaxID=926830 RepID=A0ABW2C8P2_9PSEU